MNIPNESLKWNSSLHNIFRYRSLQNDIQGNENLNEYIEKTKEFDKNLYR